MKNLISAVGFLLISAVGVCQIVNIPDANFKNVLLAHIDINTNSDSEIQVSEAVEFYDFLDVSGYDISDLTGIEAFTNLPGLYCSDNYLTSLDISANIYLEALRISHNQLTSLDVSSNPNLIELACDFNQLTSLDISANTLLDYLDCESNNISTLNLSTNTALIYLDCRNNLLTSLQLTANTALTYVDCGYNSLVDLDVSANTALITLNCDRTYTLTSIDVSNNTLLTHFDCGFGSLTSLDVSTNTALIYLDCGFNSILNLDCSNNVALVNLGCFYNSLITLNVKNGPFRDTYFNATYNPDLDCILVDDVPWAIQNCVIDSTASYGVSCTIGITEETTSSFQLFPNPATTDLTLTTATPTQTDYTLYDLSGRALRTGSFMQNTTITISDFAAGAYFIELRSEEGSSRQKFIKQ